MKFDDDKWCDVVSAFSAAALGAGNWLDGLQLLANVTGSRSGQLIGLGADHAVPFNYVSNFDPEWVQVFIDADGGNPAINPFVRAGTECQMDAVLSSAEFFPKSERAGHAFYQDCLVRHDYPFICLAPLHKNENALIGLAVLRSKNLDEITAHQKAIFSSLVPHIRAAVRTQIAMENQSILGLMDGLEIARITAFVCASDGRVIAMTPGASRLVSQGKALQLKNGKLITYCHKITSTLLAKIAEATLRCAVSAPVESVISLDGIGERCLLEITAIPRVEFLQHLGGAALVIVRHQSSSPTLAGEILRNQYRLSVAETDVCLKLSTGMPIKKIADARGCSLETTRKQVKAIFEKLGVHRQSELVAFVAQLG